MSMRTKVLTLFALFGFFIGIAAYTIFNWLSVNSLINLSGLVSPWFFSGIIGAGISIALLMAYARLANA
jgi:hypothetical protein